MRITLVGQSYDPPHNGAAVLLQRLSRGLAQAGHQVMVIMPSDRGRAYEILRDGIMVEGITSLKPIPFHAEVSFTPRPTPEIRHLWDDFRPDVVHLQDHYPLCRSALAIALKRGLPVIASNYFLPGNMTRQFPKILRRAWTERLLWDSVLAVMNQVQVVTTPTKTAAHILIEQGLKRRLMVISCGVDLQEFRPDATVDRAKFRKRYGLAPDLPTLLYVGRLDPDKSVDIPIKAMRLLGEQPVQLGIAGRGTHERQLQRLAHKLGVDDGRVIFTGYVRPQDLAPLLNSVDGFIMPSEVETQSLATLEALATGRPAIVPDAGAVQELVQDGVNGYLYQHNKPEACAGAIAHWLASREHWGEMGAASLTIGQQHGLPRMIREYEELYHSVALLSQSEVEGQMAEENILSMSR